MAKSRFLRFTMMFGVVAVAIFLAILPAFADPAPVVCAHIDDALARLEARFGERPIWTGILGDGSSILTLTASPDGSTWSALISAANGKACLAAAGTDWLLPGPPAAPAPAGEMN